MSSSVADLSADVIGVVEYLRTIGHKVTTEGGERATKSVEVVEQLTSLLTSIDTARTKAHEQLEVETIAASALRHRLGTFQHKLQIELTAAINAAQCSVVAQKANLKKCLSDMKSANTQISRRQATLERHNNDLVPRLKSESVKYRKLIEEVNQLMTNRSKVKIVLNETQDELQSITMKTRGFQEDMSRLEVEAEESRNNFKTEMIHLTTTLEELKGMISANNERNKQLTSECDAVEEELTRAVDAMMLAQQALSDVINTTENEKDLIIQLQTNAKRDTEKIQEFSKARSDIEASCQSTREHFQNEEKCLREQQRMILKGVGEIETEVSTLAVTHRTLQTALRKEAQAKDKHRLSVASVQESVSTSKKTLQNQSEESAKLQAENQEFEFQLMQCIESHQVMCGLYEDQIQNFSRSLEEENNLRKKRELEIKELNLQISSLQSELTTLTTNLATSTESSTSQRDETLQKISVLQSNVKEMEEHNLCLQNELVTVTTKLQSVREDLHSRRQELDKQNAHLKRDLMNKLDALEEIRPRCASLEDEYQHKTAMYDAEKEEIIRMKNHRNGLTDAAKQLQKQIKSIVDTQERLRMEVIRERAYAREQLRHQTLCVQKTEEQVAIANRKLEAVVTENLRISEMIETLQQDCLWMTRTCNVVKTHDTTVEETLKARWKGDDVMEKENADLCEDVVEKLSLLSTQTERRKAMISDIYTELEELVEMLLYR